MIKMLEKKLLRISNFVEKSLIWNKKKKVNSLNPWFNLIKVNIEIITKVYLIFYLKNSQNYNINFYNKNVIN
jgi:hypothetical protein